MPVAAPSIRVALPKGHDIGRGAVGALARLDERPHPVVSRGAGFDPRVPGRGVDDDPLAMEDVLALADHDVPGQRDRFRLQIVDTEFTARVLIFGDHGDPAARFDPADALLRQRIVVSP